MQNVFQPLIGLTREARLCFEERPNDSPHLDAPGSRSVETGNQSDTVEKGAGARVEELESVVARANARANASAENLPGESEVPAFKKEFKDLDENPVTIEIKRNVGGAMNQNEEPINIPKTEESTQPKGGTINQAEETVEVPVIQTEAATESSENNVEQLTNELNESLKSTQDVLRELPETQNAPLPQTILQGRFEHTTKKSSASQNEEKDIVMKTNATEAVLRIGQGIGYDVSNYDAKTKTGVITRESRGQAVEIVNGEGTMDLEELIPCEGRPLEEQAQEMEDVLKDIAMQFSKEVNQEKAQLRFGKAIESGSFKMESFREEAGAESWQTNTQRTEDVRKLYDQFPEDAKSTVIGRFLEKAQVREDGDGRMFISVDANMTAEFQAVTPFLTDIATIVERQDNNGSPLEIGMESSAAEVKDFLDGINLRYLKDSTVEPREGGTLVKGGKEQVEQSDEEKLAGNIADGMQRIEGMIAVGDITNIEQDIQGLNRMIAEYVTVTDAESAAALVTEQAIALGLDGKIAYENGEVRMPPGGSQRESVADRQERTREIQKSIQDYVYTLTSTPTFAEDALAFGAVEMDGNGSPVFTASQQDLLTRAIPEFAAAVEKNLNSTYAFKSPEAMADVMDRMRTA